MVLSIKRRGKRRGNVSNDKSEIAKLESKIAKLELEIKSKDKKITELFNKLDINDEEFENEYFKFGKYKGRSFKYVSVNYPTYAAWIIGLQAPSEHFRNFLRFFYNWKLNEFNYI